MADFDDVGGYELVEDGEGAGQEGGGCAVGVEEGFDWWGMC